MNKASGGDGIPAELFQILKDDAVKVLHSVCQQIWKTQQWPQDWKRSVFIPIPGKQCQRMIKILQNCTHFTYQQGNAQNPSSLVSMIHELRTSRCTSQIRKDRETRDQTVNIHWIIEKARGFQKNICFIDYAKAFDCVYHSKLWKILKEMRIPDHLTCLLRNLYTGQEATVRTRHGTDSFKIGKGVCQGCVLSPCLFKSYTEYLM